MLIQVIQDSIFAAIAATGFAAISRPPLRALPYCALIAAIGHASRFVMINAGAIHLHIVAATLLASFIIGLLAVFLSPIARMPAETFLFPSLLPMVPGIYAYKAFGGLVMCILHETPEAFSAYFYQFAHNGMTCIAILLCMVIGATVPIFMLKRVSFQATRQAKRASKQA